MVKLSKYTLLICAIVYIITYLILVLYRISYPFELEWCEGSSVHQVMKILSGEKIYVPPSLEFISLPYTPLYFYISAAVSKIIGIGFTPLRIVSFISSLGCFLIIFFLVKRETRSNFAGLLSASLFAATFRTSGAWFDIARVDSLFLFLLLMSIYIIKLNDSSISLILAGILVSLSFLTKQTALIISVPIMLYCILLDRYRSIFYFGTIILIIGGSTLLLNYMHDRWFNYYVFKVPTFAPLLKNMFVVFWAKDIIAPMFIACSMSVFYLFVQISKSNKKNALFYFLTSIGMVSGALLPRLHLGGYVNVLLPAYAIISIFFGLATHTTLEFIQGIPINKRKFTEICLYLICIIQFVVLKYDPLSQIPTKEDLAAGKDFINTLSHLQGDIIVPSHPYLPILAGKRSYAHDYLMYETLCGNFSLIKAKLNSEIVQAIREKRFSAIILDSPFPWFQEEISKNYLNQGSVFTNPSVFWPVTGRSTRPEFIYVPKRDGSD